MGIALGDDTVRVATPFLVIDNFGKSEVIAELEKIIIDEMIGLAVVGVPYALGGEAGAPGLQEQEILDFITDLGLATDIPVVSEDERFTSVQVDRLMSGKDLPNGRRDAVSAMLILQSYLDKLPRK